MEEIKVIHFKEIFNNKYIVPCFQREYSWDNKEIDELIDDIYSSNGDYCLGVVTITNKEKNKTGKYLIDGQQRLTTLYLIAYACNILNENSIINFTYETDELLKESNGFEKLFVKKSENSELEEKYKHIKNIVEEKYGFKEKLNNVYYYEIDINKGDNDLNHYFEVMNSRGVQLSRSDIIKSFLMSKLDKIGDKKILNNLWNLCDSMKKFSHEYSSFYSIPSKSDYMEKSLIEILEKSIEKSSKRTTDIEIDSDNSILDFDYFLLYTIRLYRKIKLKKCDDSKLFELKDLVNDYRKTFKNSSYEEIISFLNFFVYTKNIYDNYIISNNIRGNSDNSSWSLKKGKASEKSSIILIQSCLRVSFTNRKQMNWLFATLEYYINNGKTSEYVDYMRNFIRKNYVEEFLSYAQKKEINFQTGFETSHIVLNYLDFLIKENKEVCKKILRTKELYSKIDVNSFKFKFRNSIEHFLPRENENKKENESWVNDFGNLALLAYGTNTKMQNATPSNKADHFNSRLSEYSLKLQLMTLLTLECEPKKEWTQEKCVLLRNILFELLKNDNNLLEKKHI